eukprot:486993-Pleurochrysis_carterae.AAC.3
MEASAHIMCVNLQEQLEKGEKTAQMAGSASITLGLARICGMHAWDAPRQSLSHARLQGSTLDVFEAGAGAARLCAPPDALLIAAWLSSSVAYIGLRASFGVVGGGRQLHAKEEADVTRQLDLRPAAHSAHSTHSTHSTHSAHKQARRITITLSGRLSVGLKNARSWTQQQPGCIAFAAHCVWTAHPSPAAHCGRVDHVRWARARRLRLRSHCARAPARRRALQQAGPEVQAARAQTAARQCPSAHDASAAPVLAASPRIGRS